MFEEYKKRFWTVQALILVVTTWSFFAKGHQLSAAAACFVVMQVGGVFGAVWASSLRNRMQGRSS